MRIIFDVMPFFLWIASSISSGLVFQQHQVTRANATWDNPDPPTMNAEYFRKKFFCIPRCHQKIKFDDFIFPGFARSQKIFYKMKNHQVPQSFAAEEQDSQNGRSHHV